MMTWENKRKFWRPNLTMSEKKQHFHDKLNASGFSQNGFYQGKNICVAVRVMSNWLTTDPNLVILTAPYKGYEYQRNYGCLFSDHGLKMICAKFIKDIEKGKIK